MIKLILTFIAVFLTTKIVGVGYIGWKVLIIFTLILTLLNFTIKPVLRFITWPINLITLGLTYFIINVGVLLLASHFTKGFVFISIKQVIIFSIVLSLIQWLFNKFDF